MNDHTKQPRRSAIVIAAYLQTCVVFALPYLLLAGLGPRIFFRNWIRTLSGLGVELVAHFQLGINDLLPHAVIVAALLPCWLGISCRTRLNQLPVAVHVAMAAL